MDFGSNANEAREVLEQRRVSTVRQGHHSAAGGLPSHLMILARTRRGIIQPNFGRY
jgi:hypothetical protein